MLVKVKRDIWASPAIQDYWKSGWVCDKNAAILERIDRNDFLLVISDRYRYGEDYFLSTEFYVCLFFDKIVAIEKKYLKLAEENDIVTEL